MGILNYTTQIKVEKTTAEIMEILRKHGASAVLLEYDESGQVGALSFKVKTAAGECGFRLPADWRATQRILEKTARSYSKEDQARRVAWRIIKDWVEAQLAIVETEMVCMEQVFLPYMISNDGRILFERLRDGGFKSLTEGHRA